MSKGGMRWGAGRPGWRVKAEHCRRIDVRQWKRAGTLQDGYTGAWRWRCGDEPSGSIGYSVAADSVTLRYSANDEHIVERIALGRTTCTFGGSRAWFLCPRCGARVAVLYLRGKRFACRNCKPVAYTSQSEDAIGRLWRRQWRIEARIGERWQRPKGMHRSTFRRLVDQLMKCELERDRLISRFLDRFGPLAWQ